jgi:hypothetical protein
MVGKDVGSTLSTYNLGMVEMTLAGRSMKLRYIWRMKED